MSIGNKRIKATPEGSAQAPDGQPRTRMGPIRQSYALVVGDQKGRWIALVGLAFLVSGVETTGAALIYVLIGLITEPDAALELPVFGDISGWLPDVENDALLIGTGIAIGVFFVFRGVLQVVQTYAQNKVAYNAGVKVAVRLVRGYMAMPYAYHLRHESSKLVRNAVTSVQETISNVVLPATKFLAEILIVVGMTGLLVATAPIASLLAIAVLAPAVYLVLKLVKARVAEYGRTALVASRGTFRTLQQSLHGIRDIRLLGRHRYFLAEFRRQRRSDADARTLKATFSQLSTVLVETLLVLSIVGFLAYTVLSTRNAAQSVAVLGLFAYVAMRLRPSIRKIISTANNLRFTTPAIDDLHRDLSETAPWVDSFGKEREDLDPIPRLTESIRLEEVEFTYENAEVPALETVTLEVRVGESVGICGPTGGGKSTLVDIVAGLLEPSSGRVLVDGVDIRHNLTSWYRQLGVVSQGVYLFDDTLRHNIALGVSDHLIDDEALKKAISLAQLDEFVSRLPTGWDTHVGEHGTSLSGGQRQRVAIARALYHDPEIVILDEGTSALDNETEREFMRALENLRGKKTMVLVAHRLSTIEKCDRVLFVKDGRVSGGGTYDELYEQNESFRRMAV